MGITMRRYLIALSAVCIAAFGLGACSSGDPESLTFDVAIEDRSVVGGHTTFEAKQGDSVTFNLTADEAGEFHLHGYDLRAESEAGGQATIALTADATGSFPITMHPGETDAMGMGGHAETIEAPAGMGVALNVHPDSVSGFNVQIVPMAFTFAPEKVNTTHVPGEGHAHLYVDGVKLRRVYGPWGARRGAVVRHARDQRNAEREHARGIRGGRTTYHRRCDRPRRGQRTAGGRGSSRRGRYADRDYRRHAAGSASVGCGGAVPAQFTPR